MCYKTHIAGALFHWSNKKVTGTEGGQTARGDHLQSGVTIFFHQRDHSASILQHGFIFRLHTCVR